MSETTYKVPYTTILDVQRHPNADKLDICTVYGFQVIAQRDKYKVGNEVLYVPIDSILSQELEDIIFPTGSKIKLDKKRVRQIRIRGLASQGMLINKEDLKTLIDINSMELEKDYSTELNITKYEPPFVGLSQTQGKDKQRNRSYEHPLFHKYNGLESIKWFPTLFKEGEEVVINEKLHGSNARASLLPYNANTTFKKILKFLKLAPKAQKCYGSNNVQKQVYQGRKKHFYEDDVWANTFNKLDVFNKLKLGETVFGEIIGPGIQANYTYGLKEHRFVLFDVKVLQPDGTQIWLNPDDVEQFAKERGFEYVPVAYKGPYNKELAYSLTKGPSLYDPKTKVREGIVIKAKESYNVDGNKKALKWVSEDYLDDKNNTDFH